MCTCTHHMHAVLLACIHACIMYALLNILAHAHAHITCMQEAQIEELEAQLQNSRADLKNSQKRIDTLHGALKGHENYSDDDPQDDTIGDDDYGDEDLSSNASSYKVGEIDDMSMSVDDLSDTEGSGLLDQSPAVVRTRTRERRKRDLTPRIVEEEAEEEIVPRSRRTRKLSADSGDVKLTKYDKRDSDDEFTSRRPSRDYLKVSDDETKPRRKISDSKIEESPRKSQSPDRFSTTEDKSSSLRRDKPSVYDDDDDDDDLEAFLLKQRERTRKLQEEGDGFEPISAVRSRRSKSPAALKQEENKQNGSKDVVGVSKDSSAASLREEKTRESKVRSLKRNKRRRRTIEQLSSPEHQAAKANGAAALL